MEDLSSSRSVSFFVTPSSSSFRYLTEILVFVKVFGRVAFLLPSFLNVFFIFQNKIDNETVGLYIGEQCRDCSQNRC